MLPSKEDVIYKHPLEDSWTLWYFRNLGSRSWEDNLVEIRSFNTVEDFWCLFNYLKTPSELILGTDYYLFKKGIRPMWEDPANNNGGRWLICVEKKQGTNRGNKTDDYWLDLVMLIIGDNFGDYSNEVCGLTVNLRPKMDKISVWTKNSSQNSENAINYIGETIKRELRIPKDNLIYFQSHAESAKKVSLNSSIYKL